MQTASLYNHWYNYIHKKAEEAGSEKGWRKTLFILLILCLNKFTSFSIIRLSQYPTCLISLFALEYYHAPVDFICKWAKIFFTYTDTKYNK